MGRFKTEADRTNKHILRARVETLEKKVRLLDAVTANLVREVGAKAAMAAMLAQQPGAEVVATPSAAEPEVVSEESPYAPREALASPDGA